ncbi:MAG: transcriptional repressor [Lachnospiraceae bacterium]|nr:transcriptional repressor [Lachnospiraceae bacterium]
MTEKEIIIEKLKESGCRITKQRELLLDVMLQKGFNCHKEVYITAHAIDKTIGLATVYRFVNKLQEVGVVSEKGLFRVACCAQKCPFNDSCMIEFDNGKVYELTGEEFVNILYNGLRISGKIEDDAQIMNIFMKKCDE